MPRVAGFSPAARGVSPTPDLPGGRGIAAPPALAALTAEPERARLFEDNPGENAMVGENVKMEPIAEETQEEADTMMQQPKVVREPHEPTSDELDQIATVALELGAQWMYQKCILLGVLLNVPRSFNSGPDSQQT